MLVALAPKPLSSPYKHFSCNLKYKKKKNVVPNCLRNLKISSKMSKMGCPRWFPCRSHDKIIKMRNS